MLSNKQIVNEIAKERIVEKLCPLPSYSPYRADLCQDIYISLLSKDNKLLNQLYESGELKFYLKKVMKTQVNSKTSPYYYKYKKFQDITNEITEGFATED